MSTVNRGYAVCAYQLQRCVGITGMFSCIILNTGINSISSEHTIFIQIQFGLTSRSSCSSLGCFKIWLQTTQPTQIMLYCNAYMDNRCYRRPQLQIRLLIRRPQRS